jgi:YjbR protein
VTGEEFRDLALSFEGAAERSHMGHPDFRANGRIFATLRSGERLGMIKLEPDEQHALMRQHPAAFMPSSGAWGRRGCTDVRLEAADVGAVRGAMLLAWQHAMAAPPGRATKRPAAARPARRTRAK